MWRYFNMFMVIGVILVIISLAGFATGNKFLTEPGQPVNPQGSLIYLGAGVIMLINGVVSIRQAEAMKAQAPAAPPK
jgi:putative Mn2+ efflux pump MntP